MPLDDGVKPQTRTQRSGSSEHYYIHQALTPPGTYVLKLGDGMPPGSMEAAAALSLGMGSIRKRHPNKTYQFIPFAQVKDGKSLFVTALLAVAE